MPWKSNSSFVQIVYQLRLLVIVSFDLGNKKYEEWKDIFVAII